MVFPVPVPDAEAFSGPLEVVGAWCCPALAVLALILVPFIDRGADGAGHAADGRGRRWWCWRRSAGRGLTVAAVKSTPQAGRRGGDRLLRRRPTGCSFRREEMAGVGVFPAGELHHAATPIGDNGGKVGPDLTRSSIHKDAAWMIQHFKRPSAMRPGSSMPPIQLSDAQLNALAAFLLKLNRTERVGARQRARVRGGGRAGVPGESLRHVPHGERGGNEDRTAAERPVEARRPGVGWRSISRIRRSSRRGRSCRPTSWRRKTWKI